MKKHAPLEDNPTPEAEKSDLGGGSNPADDGLESRKPMYPSEDDYYSGMTWGKGSRHYDRDPDKRGY